MSKVVEVLGGVSDFYEQYSPALQAAGEGVGGAIVVLGISKGEIGEGS